ncbi:hypothetical protein evm_013707 [Chilo suppressalis]|nr:hypothetical protein evm_013707 [Chilo suppressalis]
MAGRYVMGPPISESAHCSRSVREVAITTWGTVTRTCIIRGLECEAQCWPPVEDLLSSRPLAGKEGVRAAESLALLVLPTPDNHAVSEKAVSLLCDLCDRCALSSEWLAALTPGLQLAAHHCRRHPALLPALRKLEEGVQTPALSNYKGAIEALIHNVAGPSIETTREPPRPPTNLQAAQEVGRRVTQMFQQSKNNMNLQSIFKKKTFTLSLNRVRVMPEKRD